MKQWLILFFSFVSASQLWADQYHNVNQLVGDRAIGLAGAYAGVSDDPAGMVYNPAGIAFSSSASMSANVNTLQYNQIDYDDALDGRYDYQRSSIQVLPNFFGVVQPMKGWTLGFYSAVVDSIQEKQDQSFENFQNIERFVFNLNNIATTYNVGISAARRLSDDLAIGVSLPLHYRTTEFISNQYIHFASTSSTTMEWQNIYVKTSELGVRPKLGISWALVPKLSLGLTVDQTFVLNARQSEQYASCVTDTLTIGCDANSQPPDIEKYQDKPSYPLQIRLGGAWFPNNALLVSSDVIYSSAVEQASDAFSDREATLDGAVGIEWYWSPSWALRSGAFTSFASTPELNNTAKGQDPHVDRFGATFSIARFNQGSSISIGVLGLYGTGESQLFADLAGVLQETHSLNMTAFFTTSYRY